MPNKKMEILHGDEERQEASMKEVITEADNEKRKKRPKELTKKEERIYKNIWEARADLACEIDNGNPGSVIELASLFSDKRSPHKDELWRLTHSAKEVLDKTSDPKVRQSVQKQLADNTQHAYRNIVTQNDDRIDTEMEIT